MADQQEKTSASPQNSADETLIQVPESKKESAPTKTSSVEGVEQSLANQHDEVHDVTTLHERTIAMLSYAGPLAIVPFYLKKESQFCVFHGKQGMVLAIIFFIAQLVSVLDIIMDLMLILQVGLFFYMGFKAISGKWQRLPLVYNWSCQLEKALTLKTKEEELEEMRLRPDEVMDEQPAEQTQDKPSPNQTA